MSFSSFRLMLGVCALSAVVAFGCGDEPRGEIIDPGVKTPSPVEAGVPATGACVDGSVQQCDCPEGSTGPRIGIQSCYAERWLECHCDAPAPPTTAASGACKAGRYEGSFSGAYTSGYTFIGIPIPIFSVDFTGKPGLAFTLNQTQTSIGEEFSTLTISDGYVTGTADGLFPIEGVLTGTLDCKSKKFTGTLSGGYCVGICAGLEDINEAEFEGPVVGYYDTDGFKFTSGTWDLLEVEGNSGVFGAYGGSGEWSAEWVGEGSVDLSTGETTEGSQDPAP